MNKTGLLVSCTALAMLGTAGPVLAQDAEIDRAEAERSLADAQRRLEEAAREVAELSLEMSGPVVEEIRRIRIDGGGQAMLGINIDSAPPGTNGVRVVSVSPGGPAAEAGVKSGDLVVAMNGETLGSGRDLVSGMRGVEPGETVDLDLRRNGKAVKVAVIAAPRKEMIFIGGPGSELELEGMPPMPHFLVGPFGDAELASMTPGLGRYFGTDKGLLVVHAPKAAGTSLEDGDVILTIGGREPQNPGHALRIFGSYQPGDTVEIKLLRQKKERTVTVTVPDRPRIERHIERHINRGMPAVPPPAPPVPPAPPAD